MALRSLTAPPALLLAVGLVLAFGAPVWGANSGTVPPPTTTLEFASNPTVTVAVPYLPVELNPWAPAGADPVTAMLLEQVLPQASVVDNHLQPTICFMDVTDCPEDLFTQAEEVSVGPETIVYDIDPRARWSDGVPITVSDFTYLWHEVRARAATLPAIYPVEGYEDIRSITGSHGGKTVTVVFDRPYADWPALFTDLLPAHIGLRYGFVAAFAGFNALKDLSGGPYRISRFIQGHALVLVRNPKFWGPRPSVARIIFRVEKSQATTISDLSARRISIAVLAPGPAVDVAVEKSTSLLEQSSPSPVLWQLAFNLANPVLASESVREAIAKAVDRHQLVADTVGLLTPFGSTAGNRLLPNGANGSVGNDASFAEPDVAETDSLLVQAGNTMAPDGLVTTPTAMPLRLTLVGEAGNPVVASVEQELQAELLQAGITLEITNVSAQELLGVLLPTGGYELALAPYDVSAYPSTNEVLYTNPVGPVPAVPPASTTSEKSGLSASSVVGSIAAGPAEQELGAVVSGVVSRDVLGFSDSNVASLFNEATSQLNASAGSGLYNEIDTVLWQELPTLPLFQMPVDVVSSSGLLNVSDTETWASVMWDAEDWAVELNPPSTAPSTTVP